MLKRKEKVLEKTLCLVVHCFVCLQCFVSLKNKRHKRRKRCFPIPAYTGFILPINMSASAESSSSRLLMLLSERKVSAALADSV